jgi:hypothetical protein
VTPTARRPTAERILFSLLVAAAALMAAGYLSDLIGMRLRVWLWLPAAIAAVLVWRFAPLPDASSSASELAGVAIVIAIVTGYLAWLASPSLLPVTDGPDVVHHLQLIHVLERTGRLPHDPALRPYLLEMMNYTPGSHIFVAMVAGVARVDGLRVLLPVALWFVALKTAAIYLMAVKVLPPERGRAIAALCAPILSFAPAAYALGALYQFFFFAQVVSEAFACGAVLAVLVWMRAPSRGALLLFACCGIGVMLSWPVYLAPTAAVLVCAVVFAPITWRQRLRDVALALGPILVVAIAHLVRHPEGSSILTASGAVTSPSLAVFGWPFVVLAIAGAIAAAVRREARPVLVFLIAIAVTAGALAIVAGRGGGRSFYLPFKMVYLGVAPLSVLAALALANGARLARRGGAIVVLILALLVTLPRLPWVRPRSPLTPPALAAGLWVRDHADPRCVDYFTRHWLTGYWLHLDVLGNPRDSDRMRAETFEFRDTAPRWIQGRGLPLAIVEDLSSIPRELRPDLTVVASFPPFAVISRPTSACPWR